MYSYLHLNINHLKYSRTRSSGRSAPLLLAPAEGWGALRAPNCPSAVLGAFGPLFITIKLYFINEISHFWGGLFYKTFWFEASLYMFLVFWKFWGSFFCLFFSFWISKLYFESEFPLLGGLFYKTFWFEGSLYMFLIFGNLGAFFEFDFWFLKILKLYFESEFPLLGVCFIKLFDLRPPYICFWFF